MRTLLAPMLALCLVAGPALAGPHDEMPPRAITEADRAIADERPVLLLLEQTEIRTTIELGRVANAANGGLLGALVITSMDDRSQRMRKTLSGKAEATAATLRLALADFDADALALSTTRSALARLDWFKAGAVTATKEGSARSRASRTAGAGQSAFIEYRYELSPDFSQIRVIAFVTIERAPRGRPGRSAASGEILFSQRIASIVQLRKRSYDHAENAAQWSADGGRLAKAALTRAFARFDQLLPRALELSAADIAGFAPRKNRKKVFAAGFYGPMIDRSPNDPDDVLIWSGGLIQVQPAS